MSDPTSELLAAFVAATPERKADALKVLKGASIATEPMSAKPLVGPLLLRTGVAAKLLGVSRTTIWRMVGEGRLGQVEIRRGSFRIRMADIEEIVGGCRRGRPRKSSQTASQP